MALSERELIEYLYLGMLGRKPDPEGLESNLAALARPHGLRELVAGFAQSPESALRRLRETSGAFLTTPHESSYGPINHVISLGTHCYTSQLIKTLGLKRASYPFDWLFSSDRLVLDCLEDGFERFLDPGQFRTSPIEDRAEPHINLADHAYYAERLGVRYVFNHRDPNVPEHFEYYRRAVDRFHDVLASDDVKLVLMIDSMRGIDRETFLGISRALRRVGCNVIFLAIEVVPNEDGDMLSIAMKTLVKSGEHRLVRYVSTSPIDALSFENPFDDAVLRNVLTQYTFDLKT